VEHVDLVHLVPGVTVVVHPIDTASHPTVPAGWRWAVMAGINIPPADLDRCANAGWCPTKQEAEFEGDTAGVTAVKALRMFGIPAAYALLPLDYDPIPAGCDRLGAPV